MEFPLNNGHVALIDAEDYPRVASLRWYARQYPAAIYVYTRINGRMVRLHRFILGLEDPKIEVDHINHDGLDCRKTNIRACSHRDNLANRRLQRNNTSGFKGVSRDRTRWKAYISLNGRKINLGRFKDKHFAAKAYDLAAAKYFGKFAVLNFPRRDA